MASYISITKDKKNNIKEIYIKDKELEDAKEILIYRINKLKKEIEFIPQEGEKFSQLDKFLINGFNSLPEEFSNEGYLKGSINYQLNKKLKEKAVNVFKIVKNGKSSIHKLNDKIYLTLSYSDFKKIKTKLNNIEYASRVEKTNIVNKSFSDIFPKHYDFEDTGLHAYISKALSYLDEKIIKYFKPEDNRKLLNFIELFLQNRYVATNSKNTLIAETKIKVDNIALKNVINEFEKNLLSDNSESEWGEFIKKYLFLIDSRYIHSIPQLNVALGTTRTVDFGLVDSQGYLDIFEIKKPTTQILAKKEDRGNYYWSTDAIKAIVQAEKYLHRVREKSANLENDIKREKNINISITSPRTILLIGNSSEFENDKQKEDFKILRSSFKNIEIITYDEMLDRLKNLDAKLSNTQE